MPTTLTCTWYELARLHSTAVSAAGGMPFPLNEMLQFFWLDLTFGQVSGFKPCQRETPLVKFFIIDLKVNELSDTKLRHLNIGIRNFKHILLKDTIFRSANSALGQCVTECQ